MGDVKELVQALNELDVKAFTPDKKTEISSILRAILMACCAKDRLELERQAEEFVALTFDPANVFLGYTPDSPDSPVELFNEIENKTLAVLEKIAASESDARN